MAIAKIHLKGIANPIEFECSKLTTKYHPGTGLLTEITWVSAINAPQYLNLAEVVAVQFVR